MEAENADLRFPIRLVKKIKDTFRLIPKRMFSV